jgi:glycosyltransferase involved in cell wall biosynthesis
MIVGDGPERGNLEAAARASGCADRIQFTGSTEMPEAKLAEFDIFALSSDTEQMPLSVLEAMAVELPIASIAVGDIADMVAAENRPYITAADDEPAFRKSLLLLCSDIALRVRLGQANRAVALARFDHELMVGRYAKLFG